MSDNVTFFLSTHNSYCSAGFAGILSGSLGGCTTSQNGWLSREGDALNSNFKLATLHLRPECITNALDYSWTLRLGEQRGRRHCSDRLEPNMCSIGNVNHQYS